jgi:hypothetical protein
MVLQIKYLADPSFHAISKACMNPSSTMWLGQSQDNQVCNASVLLFCVVAEDGFAWQ